MKFIIVNKTRYRTRDLRRFVTRAYAVARSLVGQQRAADWEQRMTRFAYPIRVTFARSNWRGQHSSTGHAFLNGNRVHIGLGDQVLKREIAYTLAHEFGHCFGWSHADMCGGALFNTRSTLYDFADNLPLNLKPPPAPRTTANRRSARLANIEKRLKTWQSKQRRAANAIRRLTAQQRRLLHASRRQPAVSSCTPPDVGATSQFRDQRVHAETRQTEPLTGQADP